MHDAFKSECIYFVVFPRPVERCKGTLPSYHLCSRKHSGLLVLQDVCICRIPSGLNLLRIFRKHIIWNVIGVLFGSEQPDMVTAIDLGMGIYQDGRMKVPN